MRTSKTLHYYLHNFHYDVCEIQESKNYISCTQQKNKIV